MPSLSRRRLLAASAGALIAPLAARRALWAGGKKEETQAQEPPFVASPLVSLIRDASVQTELQIAAEQRPPIEKAVTQVDLPLFLLRDVPPKQGADKYRQLVVQLEQGLQKVLSTEQYQRLSELVVRAQGFPALIQPNNAQFLELESRQVKRIQAVLDDTQREMQKQLAGGRSESVAALNENARKQIEETLTSPQRQRLAKLVGKPFDLSKVRQVACVAPELKEIERWHNAAPLSMQQLKGKVVALHFYAFG